ncbi:hypothetical protein Nisw_01440 [Candidatus Nitrosopumilus sp. SW]|uniref:DUF6659 family protein n=1 Tax=Candidatus Nitrosopumilus sp. SW TaxID=2508726 RepID=UPI00114E6AB0|nr:DUF6659 family protein [Candidatus Nitrosopumilus sp. SW]QDI88287.1 hypothetical protein Nisw_01440 [Candidatus Nitrosopumilus sp. SW]
MSKLIFEKTSNWESTSKYILSLPEIRFFGIVNSMGNLVVGNYKKGIVPIAKIDHYKICVEHALELFMKKDLDNSLGSLDYIVSKRKNIKIITIPMNDSLALISAESTTKIEPIIEDIIQSLKDYVVNN